MKTTVIYINVPEGNLLSNKTQIPYKMLPACLSFKASATRVSRSTQGYQDTCKKVMETYRRQIKLLRSSNSPLRSLWEKVNLDKNLNAMIFITVLFIVAKNKNQKKTEDNLNGQ